MLNMKLNLMDMNKFTKFTNEAIQREWFVLQRLAAEGIGPSTASWMQQYIIDHQKRDKVNNTLAKGMRFKLLDDVGRIHFGIGNKEELDGDSPGWFKINYGGKIEINAPYVRGNFTDGPASSSNSGSARFINSSYGDGKVYGKMIPEKAIDPMNYIEEGSAHLMELLYAGVAKHIMKSIKRG